MEPEGSVSRSLPPPPPVVKIRPGSGDTIHEAVCAECGKLFDLSRTSVVGNTRVCETCKPGYVQKVAERAKAGMHAFTFAGFWTRLGALFVDSILIWAVLHRGLCDCWRASSPGIEVRGHRLNSRCRFC